MSRDTGKFSYLTANKERNGKNPQIADLDETELILLADTMRKEVETMKATYAIVSIAAHWALRTSILNYNIKTFSNTNTGNVSNSTIRVGRWMTKAEYQKMLDTGKVQMSAKNMTHVSNPADIDAFTPGKHTHYVEFDIPADSVVKGGKAEWGIIPGKGSIYDKLSLKQGGAGYTAPNATNVKLVEIR